SSSSNRATPPSPSLPQSLKRGNFKCTQNSVGVQSQDSQLSTLAEVLRVVDPKLHQHI
ncbi:hypothetical protein MKX01_035256, partial [Papaver californicum]